MFSDLFHISIFLVAKSQRTIISHKSKDQSLDFLNISLKPNDTISLEKIHKNQIIAGMRMEFHDFPRISRFGSDSVQTSCLFRQLPLNPNMDI